MKPRLTRAQKNTIVNSLGLLIGLVVVLQLWLLTATMNAWMGRDESVVWPAFLVSTVCFVFNLFLVRRLSHLTGGDD
jgi:hypothetical protein